MPDKPASELKSADLRDFELSYKDRPVLVTGHTGFTGGWLSIWLDLIGADVSGLSLPPITTPNLYETSGLADRVGSNLGDITDFDTVRSVLEKTKPHVIFHLAAQPLVSEGYASPIETFATNVMGTAHILEAARQSSSVKAVVCITTDKVYRDQDWVWPYREGDPLGGKDPYSASKAAAELVGAAYQQTMAARGNNVAIGIARGGNIIGGGDWSANRIVPDFVRARHEGTKLELRNPNAVRPWQHVMALCHGYLMLGARLLENDAAVSAWNFGPADEDMKTVGELVEALSISWPGVDLTYGTADFPETNLLRVDSSKSRKDLNWRPALTFADTVSVTAEWYRAYYKAPQATYDITRKQIDAYRARLEKTDA